jgi:hypothetical protein
MTLLVFNKGTTKLRTENVLFNLILYSFQLIALCLLTTIYHVLVICPTCFGLQAPSLGRILIYKTVFFKYI